MVKTNSSNATFLNLIDGSIARMSDEDLSGYSTAELVFPSNYMTENMRTQILDCINSNYKIKIQNTDQTSIVIGYITDFIEDYELSGVEQTLQTKLVIREYN